jgi:deoxyribose-phosphate aldolase
MDIENIIKEVARKVLMEQGTSVQAEKCSSYDASYAKYMDHTVLKPATTKETLKKFCDEAREYHFASVCVNSGNIRFIAEQLKGSGVKACSVIGFPLGACTTFVKEMETVEAIKNGAQEVDMVINIGALKDKEYDYVFEDIKAVVDAAHPYALVKVIIETSALTDEEKVVACELAKRAKADFVKTSTGFGAGGATVEDVRLMKRTVGDACMVKASTGINNRETCDKMLVAGAVRMGTSKGIKIVRGDSDSPAECQNCGACNAKCPTGNVAIIKSSY